MTYTLLNASKCAPKPLSDKTSYYTLRTIKPKTLNWHKVFTVILCVLSALIFVIIYGVVGTMDYNDEIILTQAVEAQKTQIYEEYGVPQEYLKVCHD